MTTRETSEPDYYTVAEAAQLLRVSKPTVWRWIASGRLAAVHVGPRVVRIERSSIDRLVTDNRGKRPWWKRYAVSLGDPALSESQRMAEVAEINRRILARNGGKPLDSSVPLIHEERR